MQPPPRPQVALAGSHLGPGLLAAALRPRLPQAEEGVAAAMWRDGGGAAGAKGRQGLDAVLMGQTIATHALNSLATTTVSGQLCTQSGS